VHDATGGARRKRQELEGQDDDVQEVHHRRQEQLADHRGGTAHARPAHARMRRRLHALNEAVARIPSVAVIHEYLSVTRARRSICAMCVSGLSCRIVRMMVEPGSRSLLGEGRASICRASSDIIGVGDQRADSQWLEHGFSNRSGTARSRFSLVDRGERVWLEVGTMAPSCLAIFDLNTPSMPWAANVRSLVRMTCAGSRDRNRRKRRGGDSRFPQSGLVPTEKRGKN